MVAQHPDHFLNSFVMGGHCARFSTRTQILSWVKTEGSSSAHGTRFFPSVPCSRKIFSAVSLASVFDHDQAVSLCELKNPVHVCCLTVYVHRNDVCDMPSF